MQRIAAAVQEAKEKQQLVAQERVRRDKEAKIYADNFLKNAPKVPPTWTGSDRHGTKSSRNIESSNPSIHPVVYGTDDFFNIVATGITKRKRRKPRKKKSLKKRKGTSKKKRVRRKRKSKRRS